MLKPITAFVPKKLTVIDRLIIKLGDSQQSSLCILQEQLPQILGIMAHRDQSKRPIVTTDYGLS